MEKTRPSIPHRTDRSESLKKKVKQALDEQENAGIIQKSANNWASALTVHKQDLSIRITVDFKPLNKIIKIDKYPLPSVADLYAKLGQGIFFSKVDKKAAYHQIPIHPDSVKFTAFICEFGLYEYLSMPMSISSAPAWFQLGMYLFFFISFKTQKKNANEFLVSTIH